MCTKLYIIIIMAGMAVVLRGWLPHRGEAQMAYGSFHVRSTNGLRVTPPISMTFGTRADNA